MTAKSLLPEQVPPETVALGWIDPKTGAVAIDHTWWLFFYNLYVHTLTGPLETDLLQNEVYLPRVTLPTFDPLQNVLLNDLFGKRAFQTERQPNMIEIGAFARLPAPSPVAFNDAQNILANKIFGR